ncbi:MAG: fasciclin domain-containing protein [Myxococcales bacterium]|nr:fasciclin domain-containing protein [Myxococcales bacterium]
MKRLIVSLIGLSFVVGGSIAGNAGSAGKGYGHHPSQDIVETAVGAGSFNTLAKALEAADLIDTLKGEGPFTVFAPTDEAFAKIPASELDALLADKKKLTAVLTYHVVAGRVLAEDVVKLDSATTVQGSDVRISTEDGVRVNDANVIKTDIAASNGVIHVIDSVIIPQ